MDKYDGINKVDTILSSEPCKVGRLKKKRKPLSFIKKLVLQILIAACIFGLIFGISRINSSTSNFFSTIFHFNIMPDNAFNGPFLIGS